MPLGSVLFLRLSYDHQEIRRRVGGLRAGRRGIWEEQGTNLKSFHLCVGCFPEEKTRLWEFSPFLRPQFCFPRHPRGRSSFYTDSREPGKKSQRPRERKGEERETETEKQRRRWEERHTETFGGTHILTSLCRSLYAGPGELKDTWQIQGFGTCCPK